MASDPLKDPSLVEAQKEIRRHLLRQEKLKRIEEEEMRRLAAMGWKPPIEQTGPAAPPSMMTPPTPSRRRSGSDGPTPRKRSGGLRHGRTIRLQRGTSLKSGAGRRTGRI